jgi:hypothetical protein
MSEITKTVNAADIAAAREGQTVMADTINHPVGQIVTTTDTSVVGRRSSQHPVALPTGDLGTFLARPVEIASGVLTNGDAAQGAVVTLDPWDLFLAVASVADKTANFSYFRGTLDLTFVLSSPGNAYGLYALTAVPNAGVPSASATISNVARIANCLQTDVCAAVDIALSTTVELSLPFVMPEDYATLSSRGANMWMLTLFCLQPVGTPIEGGVTEANYKIYARSTDIELVVPMFQGGKRKKHLVIDSLESAKTKMKSLGISMTSRKIENAAAGLASVPVIGTFAAPIAQAAGLVADVASWFGFSRETTEGEPRPIVNRALSNVAHVDGNDSSDLASLSVANAISVDPILADGTADDCAAFSSLFSRPTLVEVATWDPTDATGTTLVEIPVTPFFTRSSADTGIDLTVAGYCGLPFAYWRGDIHYKIFIPCSKMHRGAFQVAWLPSTADESAATLTNVTMNVVRELECGIEMDVIVGYAREKPALRGEIYSNATILNLDEINGRLVIRVVNPLRSQSDLASTRIFVFQSAGENMEFTCLRDTFRSVLTASNDLIDIKFQGGGATGDEPVDEIRFNVVEGGARYPCAAVYGGETITSARALMQKPTIIYSKSGGAISQVRHQGPAVYGALDQPATGVPCNVWTIPNHYRFMFVGVAGSERIKVMQLDDAEQVGVAIGPYVPNASSATAPAYPTNLSSCQWLTNSFGGVEVTVPYYTPKKFSPTLAKFAEASAPYDYRISLVNRNVTTTTPLTLWCFGPDLRVAMFRQLPRIALTSEAYIRSGWAQLIASA